MAKILVGIYINQNYNNPDFTIELPDDVIEQIEYMYKRALKNLVWMKILLARLIMSS
jgi:hypothetical protein